MMYAAAERAARTREAVLATISHDLRDPLSTITLAASFLLEDLVPADDAHRAVRRHLQAILRAADRMHRLVGDLLDASALDAGRLRLDLAPHTVRALLDEAHESLAPLAAAKGVALAVERPPHDPAAADGRGVHPIVSADRDRLLQVFGNLGGNAIKFTPSGGRVTVSAARAGDAIEFRIADFGPGIAVDDLPRVFDRFWQARSTARLGTGLGLAIAKGIVDAHGGRIGARSVVGEGSTFAFTIPLAPPEHVS
ncbi:hypothetical protein tb265_47170 [Gemmatimonadetes bacterium T265]|nr:hypothetical protein tb265_47170 [Gemmatimonadetes bacterium T265]